MSEPITFVLGMAVGKAVFKSWFKDNEFVSSVSDSLSDLITRAIPDWKTRSAARRQMERLSEKATEALEPLIENEFMNLENGEKATCVFQVQKAIDATGINSLLISKCDFDTSKLYKLVLDNADLSPLNSSAKQLGYRLISECVQMIVDLSGTLPNFHRDTYAEILQRENVIIDSVDKIFDEIVRIRENSAAQSSSANAKEFEQSYRRAVIRRLDRIELFGLNSSASPSSRQHNLSTAYISLSVSGESFISDNDNESASQYPSSDTTSNSIQQGSTPSIRVEDAACISPRIVIKGEAGSGKTTLLQSLAVRSASGEFTEDMSEWNHLIPFFISLREISGANLPAPEDFPKQIASVIAGTMPVGWVHEQLTLGRGLILIDGLDEVSDERRQLTRKWIEELLEAYPVCRVLITSRPPAIPDGWLAKQNFSEIELLPMSPQDVSSFIDHWHDAVAKEENDQTNIAQTLSLAVKLKARIRADRALRELAATPLLCAMLCAMNRDRKEVLPSNRISLYESAVQLVLHNRDEQRKIVVEDLPSLDFETKRDLLQIISLWMMENYVSMADEWRIVDLISNNLPRFPRLHSNYSAQDIVRSLIIRSGLLRSPVEDKCDFIHNAFKEYLCARAISDGDKFGYLETQVVVSESWREIAPMAAAITDDIRRSGFLRQLLRRGDASSGKKAMYHLLAVRCLETCTQLDPDLQTDILDRIKGLKPPKSVAEAKALSAAGDLAAELVRKTTNQHARTAAACVRTLRLIGTPLSLELLEGYGADARATVVKELLSAWPFYDRREYAQRVMSQSKGLWGGLRLSDLDSMEGLSFLKQLSRLFIFSRQPMSFAHMAELQGLVSLEDLQLFLTGSFDIYHISKLNKLKSITVKCTDLHNAHEIGSMNDLRVVDINCSNVIGSDSISLDNAYSVRFSGDFHWNSIPISIGRDLNLFHLLDSSDSFDFSPLKSAVGLRAVAFKFGLLKSFIDTEVKRSSIRNLWINRCEDMENLDFLEYFNNIDRLSLHNCYKLNSISNLKLARNIRSLTLARVENFFDLDHISNLVNLNELHLTFKSDDVDLSVIKSMKSLRKITVNAGMMKKFRNLDLGIVIRHAPY
ncbi:NACHT domain-containing protein [Sphingobium sp. BHU LFT2]|uniref:NACHT domain-containing protein n=1 Tax=Sphingobium sp. BHU LFT2 TaxID=2807634 RepID=UPI001BE820DA|nr:NACHT domain-containing protein [Sphingobium sp. BHU LFT2]MBT2243009.1 NACHT domain-containing protein [Sphingobium sp. BHU LFT2]